jgi:hypothetical protein
MSLYRGMDRPALDAACNDSAAVAWAGAGLKGELLPLPNENHFTILDHLITPKGALSAALSGLLAKP